MVASTPPSRELDQRIELPLEISATAGETRDVATDAFFSDVTM